MDGRNTETMYANARTRTDPVDIPLTLRQHVIDVVTSVPAGKMIPLKAIRLHPGDSLQSTRIACNVMMQETADELLNAVNVKMSAYLVPDLAKARFEGSMDALMKSYAKEPPLEGMPVIPYIRVASDAPNALEAPGGIHYYMGVHAVDPASGLNFDYVESYNLIWNWRAANRSKNIEARIDTAKTVGPAFWNHSNFNNIVSSYDQALIVGEVDLDVQNSKMMVKRDGPAGDMGFEYTQTGEYRKMASGGSFLAVPAELSDEASALYTELIGTEAKITLAGIAAARRTERFAKMRQQYSGHEEDWVIDRLMSGLEIPEQAYKQPILLDTVSAPMGTLMRYATDAGNLDQKTTVGQNGLVLNVSTPRVQSGGTVMVVMEILPDQVFERAKDYWLEAKDVDDLPEAISDFLDEEPVTIVENSHVDVAHSTPTDAFGFMPLNDQWNVKNTNIGGKFYRDNPNLSYDEDREKLWLVEFLDPVINQDWYVANQINQNPFAFDDQDPFEVQVKGDGRILGLTQFGGRLIEADDEYDKTAAKGDDSLNPITDVPVA